MVMKSAKGGEVRMGADPIPGTGREGRGRKEEGREGEEGKECERVIGMELII